MALNAGAIEYNVTVDTAALLSAERQVDKSSASMEASLTAVADATKTHAAAAGMAAKAVRDASSANDAATKAARSASDATQQYAMSSKALAAANRNLPAQITDIVTGLLNGQSVMQVATQQGGQLKDMYGGIGNAARALGTYVVGLISPLTAVASAVGVLALGFFKGRAETEEFRKTLALTGDQSGVTVSQLNALAVQMDSLQGITRGKAASALNEFAAAGIQGTESLARFTEVAIRLEQVGGPAVETTAKAFRELAKDPVNASLKLNESVNFLTTSVYEQIQALVDQGKTAEAASVAQEAYADAIGKRAKELADNIGLLERSWNAVAKAAKEGWDAILDVGREDTLDEKLAKARDRLNYWQKLTGTSSVGPSFNPLASMFSGPAESARQQVLQLEQQKKAQEDLAKSDADRLAKLRAYTEFKKAGLKYLSDELKMQQEIDQATNTGRAAGVGEKAINDRIAAIKASYEKKDTKPAATKSPFDQTGYLAGLAERAATEWDRIGIIEEEALRKNDELLKKRNIDTATAEQARLLILQRASDQRAAILLAEIQKDAADRDRATAERQKGRDRASGDIAGGDPVAKIEAERQARLAQNQADYQKDLDNLELYAAARVAIEEQAAAKIKEIRDKQQKDQTDQQSAQLQAYGSLFGNIADVTKAFAGKQSGIYKALFAASKAFAIADSIIKIQQGIANAAALPFPANLAAIGSVVAATSSIVSTISGVQYGGGRQYGGPASAGSFYRVNETGAPEMFTASNGNQYMLPTKSGQVTPAGEVGGSGGGWTINVYGAPEGTTATVNEQARTVEIAVARAKAEIAGEFSSNSGSTWNALRGSSNVRGQLG